MEQKTYVMIKPEFANNKEIVDYVKKRIKEIGLKIVKEAKINYTEATAKKHYAEHKEKPFFDSLVTYITSDIAIGMIVEGVDAIKKIREIAGATKEPAVGTIRHDVPVKFNVQTTTTKNIIHSSDSEENACKEIEIFEELSKQQN